MVLVMVLMFVCAFSALCNCLMAGIQGLSYLKFTKATYVDDTTVTYVYHNQSVTATCPPKKSKDTEAVFVQPSLVYPFAPEAFVACNPRLLALNILIAVWTGTVAYVLLHW